VFLGGRFFWGWDNRVAASPWTNAVRGWPGVAAEYRSGLADAVAGIPPVIYAMVRMQVGSKRGGGRLPLTVSDSRDIINV